MIVHSESPLNAEPSLSQLRDALITPQRLFYVRSHGSTPALDAASHRLSVRGQVATPLDLSMAELRQLFAPRSVRATMQCAGNRRAELEEVRPVSGNPWAPGAIGNAEWTGAALADVLRAAGAQAGALHVAFDAADQVETPEDGRFTFGVSIAMDKAMSPDVLLAYAMNGETLAPEHGYPLRVVAPGFAGVRSPKWLTGITVQERPSGSPMQQHDYKLLPPAMTAQTVDWSQGVTINDLPLNAAICDPAPHAVLRPGPVNVRGYAIASGRAVCRVDLSADDGRSWVQARLQHDPAAPWSWTFWEATVHLSRGEHQLAVRAWDAAGQTQPSRPDDMWNFKGYLCAAWHRVPVRIE